MNSTARWVSGPAVPTRAVSVAGPAVAALMLTVARPVPSRTALSADNWPRVVLKLTVPDWGFPPPRHSTVTAWLVPGGISAPPTGSMNTRLSSALTDRGAWAVSPSAVAAIVSSPPAVPVTSKLTSPWVLVTSVVADSTLPASELISMLRPPRPAPAEFLSRAVNGTTSPRITLSGPSSVRVVPDTVTVTASARAPAEAWTTIGRLDGSPPVPSSALALPVASVSGSMTWSSPESALKMTGTPSTTLLFASRTKAVSVTGVLPADGSRLLLATSVIDDTGEVPPPPSGGSGWTIVESLPHPTRNMAARNAGNPMTRRVNLLLIMGLTRISSWAINRCCCLHGGSSA